MAKITNELRECQNIPRKLIFDNTISDRARFVYCFMAAKPEDWDFFLEPMAKEIGYSVETLRKYINELVNGGWLVKGEQTNEDGRFGAVEYTIKAAKVLPTTDLQYTENTDTENFRHGKNPTQHKIDNIHKIDCLDKEEREEEKEIDKSISKKTSSKGDILAEYDLSSVPSEYIEVIREWCEYKRERREKYKTQKSFESMVKRLVRLSGGNPQKAMAIVEQSIGNNYAGLFELKQNNGGNNMPIGFKLEGDVLEKMKKQPKQAW